MDKRIRSVVSRAGGWLKRMAGLFPRQKERSTPGKPEWLERIEAVNREALAAGMSYGRYAARLERTAAGREKGRRT